MSGRALMLASALAAAGRTACGRRQRRQLARKAFLSLRPALRRRAAALYRAEPLRNIARASTKENRYWNTDLAIVGFGQIRQIAFRTWAPNTIPRRFCSAIADASDGIKTPSTIHRRGYQHDRFQLGVEWCVVGLDRNWAYNPACKMARP